MDMQSRRGPRRSSEGPRNRKWIIALAVAVVAGLVVWGVAVAIRNPLTTQATSSASPTMSVAAGERPVAVFLGDSYTQGVGASSKTVRWTTLLAANEGWTEVNLGRGGTGYVSTAGVSGCGLEYCPSYPEMIAEELPVDADIAVIAGGQNDFNAWKEDSTKVTAAIDSTLSALRAELPDAKIIVVGPSTPWEVGPTVIGMSAVVQAAAASIDANFVQLIDPPVLSADLLADDGAHPNDEGHAAIAERVAAGIANR